MYRIKKYMQEYILRKYNVLFLLASLSFRSNYVSLLHMYMYLMLHKWVDDISTISFLRRYLIVRLYRYMYLVLDEGSFSIFMILFCLLLSTLLCILMYLSCAYDSYMSSLFSNYDIALVRATTRSLRAICRIVFVGKEVQTWTSWKEVHVLIIRLHTWRFEQSFHYNRTSRMTYKRVEVNIIKAYSSKKKYRTSLT